jgi:thiol-disulfide isomerase/thioredoxin
VAALVCAILVGGAAAQGASVGAPLAEFALRDADGVLVRSGDLRGRVWMVNLWATWCPPCRNELPLLARAASDLEDEGLGLLLVNVGEPARTARAYLAAAELSLRTLVDPDVRDARVDRTNDVMRRLRVRGLPTTYFLDADGIVRSIYVGELTVEALIDSLATLGLTWQR